MRIQLPQSAARRKARIEIIPLIDIIFFLLATFVMVSLSMVQNQGLPVHLPMASSAVSQDRKASVTISITQDGGIYLDKDKITENALVEKLKVLKNSEPDLKVFINGDQHAYFGNAIHIFDDVRAAGITKVSIQTKNKNAQ